MSSKDPAEGGLVSGDRLWYVTAYVPFPMWLPTPPGGGLPPRLDFHSRVGPESEIEVVGIPVRLRVAGQTMRDIVQPGPGTELAELVMDVRATDAREALSLALEPLELVLDDLSLRMLVSLQVLQFEVLDITPPIGRGEEREFGSWPGFGAGKFSRSQYMDQESTELIVQLRELGAKPGGLLGRAMDWFVKGLATTFDPDKFLCFWIATELLWKIDGGPQVSAPYLTGCNHKIHSCPECGSDISKPVLGLSIKAYLAQRAFSEDDTASLWELRQIVHGSRDLDDEQLLQKMPRLVQLLRADALVRIKEHLGIAVTDPPLIALGPVIKEMGLGGTRKKESGD